MCSNVCEVLIAEQHLFTSQMLVACGTQLKGTAKQMKQYAVRLNKVVHFTVATIVQALQLTTVYPAVKVS